MRILFLLLLPIISFGQKKESAELMYPYLSHVEINSEKMSTGVNGDEMTFIKDNLSFRWEYSKKDDDFSLTIANEGKKSIKVLWQESAFVSPATTLERIFYGGMKYFGRYSEQLPTRIFSKTSISNKLLVYTFTDDNLRKLPIYTGDDTSIWAKMDEIKAKADKTNYRFILVIDTNEGVKEYDFYFSTKLKMKGK